MAKGFYISNLLAMVCILFAVTAIATIIGLSVVYSKEMYKNMRPGPTVPTNGTETTTTEPTTPQPNNPWNRRRLPKSLIPQHYDVQLQPYLERNPEGLYVFKGRSTVYFRCEIATNLVLIHSNKLNYTMQGGFFVSLAVTDRSTSPSIKRSWLEVPTQYLVVELNRDLEVGKTYVLHSQFTGELADDLAGFYRSEYKEGNETRIIATTQMQAPDARKSFPCFDEPAMKATFNITLIHMPQFVALSNMPNISTAPMMIDSVTWHVTRFEKTPKMSTYLLAFIVCDFDKIERTENKVQIRIWARKKAIEEGQGAYALNITGPILSFYEKYYQLPYPLPKSDQIALPDFSAGAMENWGLITYRETALLYDSKVSSIGNKERLLIVIAHELAHQWFGNLVTLRWWNDLWLNEGFASYVEYLGADQAEPSWNIKDLIVLNDIYRVMGVDALASSHPLSSKEEEINTSAEISELFDSISYSKGAAVIRMLSEFLTEPVFVQGLRSYLRAFAYNNTIYDDLWVHLQKAVANQTAVKLPKSVKSIMDTWTLQMGFPVVTVNTTTGLITQKHFLLDSESKVTRPSAFNYTWIVPVTSVRTGSRQPDYWLQEPSAVNDAFKVDGGSSDWILANLNMTGYYRVNYDQENWKRIIQQLRKDHTVISVINRAQIIDDAFNLARAKYIQTIAALETTRFLTNETEYMPWEAALGSLNYFTLMFDRSNVYGPMKKYLQKQVTPLFQYFKTVTRNWTVLPDGLMNQYNEVNAINTACTCGMPECWALASDLYKKWMNDPIHNTITPNLKSTIYCHAIARGGETEWNFAWDMLKNATVATEADKLRAALACTKEPWLLNRYLQYTMDPTKIRKQDSTSTITLIANNAVGQSLAWDFVRANWKTLFSQHGTGTFSFANLVTRVTRRFSSEFDLKQLEQFKKDNEDTGFGSATRALEQALEKTKANIKWVQENSEPVWRWFEENL